MHQNINYQDDGFVWAKGTTSNPDTWTLHDPNGYVVAHVYPGIDSDKKLTWWAITGDGYRLLVADDFNTAIIAVDSECRPCAVTIGEIRCNEDRAPGSKFCSTHQRAIATTPDVTLPHLWMCGCLINNAGAHRVRCPAHMQGKRS